MVLPLSALLGNFNYNPPAVMDEGFHLLSYTIFTAAPGAARPEPHYVNGLMLTCASISIKGLRFHPFF